MVLRTIQEGRVVDVPIRAGEVLLIPPLLPHSPQRPANSVGLVIERARRPGERDGFQWYCERCGQRLYEEFFELTDIEKQFPPVFERFFASRERRTCRALRRGHGAHLVQARVALGGRRGRHRPGLARGPGGRTGFRRRPAAALRRAARQRAPVRDARLRLQGLGRARRELQLRGDHADPSLQRHAHRVRRTPDTRAPRRLARHAHDAAAGAAAVGHPGGGRRARAATRRRRTATGSSSAPLSRRGWRADTPFAPCALIVRTLPNDADKRTRDYTGQKSRPTCRRRRRAGW